MFPIFAVVFGALGSVGNFKSLKTPTGQYTSSTLIIYKTPLLGQLEELEIPFFKITKIQIAATTLVEVYFLGPGYENDSWVNEKAQSVTLDGNAQDLSAFLECLENFRKGQGH